MITHRCPHPATGQITWPATPRRGEPSAAVDVCDRDACRAAAHRQVEDITGHTGVFTAYPPRKTPRRAAKRPARTVPKYPHIKADEVGVPWDVLGALLLTAPAEVEEWAEKQLGSAVVTQAIHEAPGRFQELVA